MVDSAAFLRELGLPEHRAEHVEELNTTMAEVMGEPIRHAYTYVVEEFRDRVPHQASAANLYLIGEALRQLGEHAKAQRDPIAMAVVSAILRRLTGIITQEINNQ